MKKILLGLCCLLMAGLASAQCNPQFTFSSSPSGNNLLRYALSNNTAHSWAGTQYPSFWFNGYGPGTVSITGSAWPGSTAYANFSAPGTYTLSLIMLVTDSLTNALICGDTLYQNVTVAYPSCASTITASSSAATYSFTASTPAGTTGRTYSWSYGDGTSGTGITASHTYAANGTYTVTLTVTGPGGCTYTNTKTVVVSSIPMSCAGNHAQFTTSISGSTVTFTNNSAAPTTPGVNAYYSWDFGDGSMLGTTTNTTHTYSASGTYPVTLISAWIDSVSGNMCGDTAHQSVTVTAPPAPTTGYINGSVVRVDTTGSHLTDVIRVWLISYNQATNMLQAIDSTTVDSAFLMSGAYYNYYGFSNVPIGSYLVKAARIGGTPGNNGPLPTYQDSSLYWSSAVPVTVMGGTTTTSLIRMRTGVIGTGPGFIGGNVSLGANRGTTTGVPGMTILLRNSITGLALRAATTDANGDYRFSNIPTGIYSIYPEDLGYMTTPRANIAITNAQSNVQGVRFNEDRSGMTIKPVATSIAAVNANGAVLTLYPNPARGAVTLSWKGFDNKEIEISVANIAGQVVHTQHITGTAGGSTSINISRLQTGVYTVQLRSAAGNAMQKLIVQ